MIDIQQFLAPDFQSSEPKELTLLSIISQTFFQPFSVEDNLLVILTALTSGSGVGFNRAMLFRTDGATLKGKVWLGPQSADEARAIWDVLSTPGIGYVEIIEHNRWLLSRESESLSGRIKSLSYPLRGETLLIPAQAATRRETLLIRDARHEPLVDPAFLSTIDVDEFLCIPLLSRDDVLGLIILDNAYTRRPIEPKDVKLASLCGLMAGNYISASDLHRKILEMERLAALGEMALFITHQLRNPLAAIGGFADQLLSGTEDEMRKRRNLEIIRGEIRRLENLLSKLARFLKVDVGQAVPFDLRPELSKIVQSSDFKLTNAGTDFGIEVADDLPWILGDPTTIGEALRNLLVNAFEATPTGGTVRLRAHRGDPGVVVEIRDTGTGMPPGVKDKLFTPFFTTKDKGLGLGLLFVKRVMDSCGGKIEVESESGRGTTVRLHFRIADEGRRTI